jgi:WD40 repeat protein
VVFSPNGKMLAIVPIDDDKQSKNNITLLEVSTQSELATLKGHSKSITSVAFSPDGKTLATGSDDETLKLWDTRTRQELAIFKVGSAVTSVAFSCDGKMLAIGSSDHTARLWYAATDAEVAAQCSQECGPRKDGLSPGRR